MNKKTKIILGVVAGLGLLAFFFVRRKGDGSGTADKSGDIVVNIPKRGTVGTPATDTPAATPDAPAAESGPLYYAGYLASELDAASEDDRESWWQKFIRKKGKPPTAKQEDAWFRKWLRGYAKDHRPDL